MVWRSCAVTWRRRNPRYTALSHGAGARALLAVAQARAELPRRQRLPPPQGVQGRGRARQPWHSRSSSTSCCHMDDASGAP